MIKYLICCPLIFFASLAPQLSFGQEVKTNENGVKIVVYSDGSWRYYEPADSVLIKKEAFLQEDDTDVNPFELPKGISGADSVLALEINQLITIRKASFDNRNDQYTKAISHRISIEDKLDSLYENLDTVDDAEIKKTERNLKRAKDLEGLANDQLKEARYNYDEVLELLKMKGNRQRKAFEHISLEISKSEQATFESTFPTTQESEQTYTPIADLISPGRQNDELHSNYRCSVIESMDEEFNGKKRFDTKEEILMTHTQADMRPYLNGREFITNYANLTAMAGFTYLNMTFIVASKTAKQMFGNLEPNSLLQIKLINGETIRIYNNVYEAPTVEEFTGNIIFKGHYLLDKSTVKILSKYELDKIRVVWSTGYEDYEIYNVDFLQNHIQCLNEHL